MLKKAGLKLWNTFWFLIKFIVTFYIYAFLFITVVPGLNSVLRFLIGICAFVVVSDVIDKMAIALRNKFNDSVNTRTQNGKTQNSKCFTKAPSKVIGISQL